MSLYFKAKEALEVAQKALLWYKDDSNLDDEELYAHVLRCVGVGYSLFAAEG